MSTLDEIRAYIIDARSRCARGIDRQHQRMTLTGKPNPCSFKIASFERGIAKYDRWLDELETRQSADATGTCRADASG